MQYQVNATGTWQTIASGATINNLNHNDIITVRLYDKLSGSTGKDTDVATLQVVDKEKPQAANIVITETITNRNIKATITQRDNESGVDITKCKWVYNTSSTEIGTEESKYTGGTFSTTPQEIELKQNIVGTYYLHVLTVDKAGNETETISKAIEVKQLVEEIEIACERTCLHVGTSINLTTEVKPDNAVDKRVTWSSSDNNIATVDQNGTVTGKALGETTITATAEDGSNVIGTYQVVVAKEEGTVATKPSTWTSTEVTAIEDGGGNIIPIPNGFYYVGGCHCTGLVISDKQGDTMDASGVESGNQFVWIPVKSEQDLKRTNFDSNGKPTANAPSGGYSITECT